MGSEGRMRDLVLRFTEDPEWLPSVSQDITDAIMMSALPVPL